MGEVVVAALAVIAVTLIIGMTLTAIVGKVMDAKRARFEARPAAQSLEMGELIARQAGFEERLRVLERIATDRGTLLASEIEALRIEKELS